jgi:hypothetical protein
MNRNIITKLFEHQEIFFDQIENELYLNATKTAKVFKKDLSNWKKSSTTIEYMEILNRSVNSTERELMIIRQGGNDKNSQGTWIHKSLIILFARWLSPEFAVWCDLQIEEILKSQNSQPIQTQTSQDFDIKSYTQQNRDLIELIKIINSENAMTLHYLDKIHRFLAERSETVPYSPIELFGIDLDSYYFIPTELCKFLNKSAVVRTLSVSALALKINKILEAKGFQVKENGVWQLTEVGKKYAIQLDNNYQTIKWKLKSIL